MSNTPQVVDGEASESDSEVEIGKTPDAEIPVANAQASVISGEASESEEEGHQSPPPKCEAPQPPPISPNQMKMYTNSLLHNRLWEVNVSMRRDVEVLGLHTMKIAYERMASLNKELLSLQDIKLELEFSELDSKIAKMRKQRDILKEISVKLKKKESIRVADSQVTLARARSRQVQEQLKNCHFQTALPTVKIE